MKSKLDDLLHNLYILDDAEIRRRLGLIREEALPLIAPSSSPDAFDLARLANDIRNELKDL